MSRTLDVTCLNCSSVIRVAECGYGVRDENPNFDCPICDHSLFSSDGTIVYDIVGVVSRAGDANAKTDGDV